MLTIEKLNDFGADTQEGLGRCYGNEALYLRLVGMIPAEANFDKLQGALKQATSTKPLRRRTRSRACWAIFR